MQRAILRRYYLNDLLRELEFLHERRKKEGKNTGDIECVGARANSNVNGSGSRDDNSFENGILAPMYAVL